MKVIRQRPLAAALAATLILMVGAGAGVYWLRVHRPAELRLCEGIVVRSLTVPAGYSRVDVSYHWLTGDALELTMVFDTRSRSGALVRGRAVCWFNGEVDALYDLPIVTSVQVNGEEVLGLEFFDMPVRRKVANSWY